MVRFELHMHEGLESTFNVFDTVLRKTCKNIKFRECPLYCDLKKNAG